jgi:hypothetical protein
MLPYKPADYRQNVCRYKKDCEQRGCTDCSRFEPMKPALDAYYAKIRQAQFGGCSGCGSDERVRY